MKRKLLSLEGTLRDLVGRQLVNGQGRKCPIQMIHDD